MRYGLFLLLFILTGVVAVAALSREDASTGKREVVVRDFDESGNLGAPAPQRTVERDNADWLAHLGQERYRVLRERATEAAGTGALLGEESDGYYVCAGCGLPLFHSAGKFHSGCGWPSFFRPVALENIGTRRDLTHGMVRTEILCARCGGHLGHLFEDGPAPTGLRYCVNSASLTFLPRPHRIPSQVDTATFAAGCFWGVEKLFYETPGVVSTRVGYSGGHADNPTYPRVCTGTTGHAEAVEVVFDPSRIGYPELVRLFFQNHDPTTRDRQGPDVGSQYRSAVFYHDSTQLKTARAVLDSLTKAKTWSDPVVTSLEPAKTFWPAEEYHQKYFLTHPVQCHARRP